MEVSFEGAISRGWQFAKSTERLFVMFVVYFVSALLVLLPVISIYRNITLGALFTFSFALSLLGLVVAIVIAVLLIMFSTLMFTHNYANQKSLRKSASFAKKKYLRFLGAMIIVTVISVLVTFPFSLAESISQSIMARILVNAVNFIVSIILGLMFFFVQQEIAVGGSRIMKSLTNSYAIFKRDWVQVLITLIVSGLLGLLIILISAIPLILVAVATIVPAISTGQFVPALLANLPLFLLSGLILIFGAALSTLFTTGIKTDVYMQLKKRK